MNFKLKSINDNLFNFRIEDKSFISVLNPGYIINLDGNFIDVKDNEDHSQIFSSYLRSYLENENMSELSSINAAKVLIQLNHIVYFGVKSSDKINSGNSQEGLGVLILPNNLDNITTNQKEAIKDFLNTNKSIFGKGKKIVLDIDTFDGKIKYTEEELLKKLEQENNKFR